MPRQVDHDQRRRDLARTAAEIIAARGLDALTFRELALRAGVSVALVQHYFGTKAELLVHTLDRVSDEMGARIVGRLADLGLDASPGARVLALAEAFLPTDDASRDAMVVYLSFAAGALTDASLRDGAAFARGEEIRAFVSAALSGDGRHDGTRDGTPVLDPDAEATTIVAMLLGLSFVALLPGAPDDVRGAIRRHLTSLGLLP